MEPAEIAFLTSLGFTDVSFIAQGGYGSIWKVFSPSYNRQFAIKKVPLEMFKEEELDCFKIIDDTRIVNLYKFYKYDNFIYLVMEYCPYDLEIYLKNQHELSTHELARFMHDMLAAVKACHDRNIAHCNIKPSNFLIDEYGRIKICNFGLSTIMKDEYKSKTFGGTKLFMPPEIVSKREFNPFAADVWSLGVTFYFMASHQYPFFSTNSEYLFEKIVRGIYETDVIENAQLKVLIAKCLETDPSCRATVDELLKMPFITYNMPQPNKIGMYKHINATMSHNIVIRPKFLKKNPIRPNHSFVNIIPSGSILNIGV